MSRARNFSCASAEPRGTLAPAQRPNAAPLAFTRKSRRLVLSLSLISRSVEFALSSIRPGQPNPKPSLERTLIQEVCQRHVLGHEPGGVNQNPFVVALTALLCA